MIRLLCFVVDKKINVLRETMVELGVYWLNNVILMCCLGFGVYLYCLLIGFLLVKLWLLIVKMWKTLCLLWFYGVFMCGKVDNSL